MSERADQRLPRVQRGGGWGVTDWWWEWEFFGDDENVLGADDWATLNILNPTNLCILTGSAL